MKPLLVSSGEPAGIGPDICLALAQFELPIVILADKKMLAQRALQLNQNVELLNYNPSIPFQARQNALFIHSIPCAAPVVAGQLNPQNASYVLTMLSTGIKACLDGEFRALVTAPVHKAVINQAGIAFTGHTEFLASYCGIKTVVMMLACDAMKMALVTTHLPLGSVANSITSLLISDVIKKLHTSLQKDFGIASPRIYVAGLNPHAGEGGYLGREEIDTIIPALAQLRQQNINVQGPFPADTLFTPHYLNQADAFVAMYHDQGLPVLKYAGFGQAVNITLGLPIIRTSVDHGTALDLAGTGLAETGSLLVAINTAISMSEMRKRYDTN